MASRAQIGEDPRVSRALAFAVMLVALTSAAAPARAEEPGSVEAQALDLFDKSEASYQKGRFAEAARYLRDAYALRPEPVLLYNLARAYEGMGELEHAAHAYEDFLAAEPNAKDRASIETRVATLHNQIAERDAAQRRASAPPPKKVSPVPWIVAGAGAVGIGVGAVLAVSSANRHRDAIADTAQTIAEHDQDAAKSLATAANVAFIAGGVAAAIGVVWGLLDLRAVAASRSASLAPWAAPGAVGLALAAPIN
jgi:tetratricopeptide (TPR) repeat protein